MQPNSLKLTGLILTIIIVIPSIVVTIIQFNSLNDTEKAIEGIYTNRLEAILFSINQHSNNQMNEWQSNINIELGKVESSEQVVKELEELRRGYVSVGYMFFSKPDGTGLQVITKKDEFTKTHTNDYKNLIVENSEKIERLVQYYKKGYAKTEPLGTTPDNRYTVVVFLTNINDENYKLCGMMINTQMFFDRNLRPKIEESASTEFIITITDKDKTRIIYPLENVDIVNIEGERKLWLFPDYLLGIQLKGASLEKLAKARNYTNIFLISGLTLFIIIAAAFAFRQIKRQLEFAQIKSDFVSNVSHELRTPLALISMFAETLEMDRVKTEEKKKEYYSIISQEAGRLSRIVNKILNFSKMEAGKRKYQMSKVNLNVIVEDILKSYSFHIKNKGFSQEFVTDKSLDEIYVDPEAVAEAVVNLIDNAMKYSKDEKSISIMTGKDANYAFISVQDKGIGISSEDQDKIFDKFFRVSTGLVHNAKGTGLGLSLVKHIMEAHSGKIELQSKPGEGSTFTLKFPLMENGVEHGENIDS